MMASSFFNEVPVVRGERNIPAVKALAHPVRVTTINPHGDS
jgi:hypothetical protein